MHRTGTREQWREERIALLEREKELTRLSDELARERQALPWVEVEQEYVFDTPGGRRTLADAPDGGTEVRFDHERITLAPPNFDQPGVNAGWTSVLDKLEALYQRS